MSPKQDKNVALIIGPTASGKSALALELAKNQALADQQAVIINADSAQVYRDLQILSARPTQAEMQGIEHLLYGHVDGGSAYSAVAWANDAKLAIENAHRQNILPILVGGTGLYVRTLLDGIAPIPEIDPDIRQQIRSMERLEAYQALCDADPQAAQRLNPTDSSRIQRALEVIRSTGQPLHHWHQQSSGGIGGAIKLHPLILLPPRDWLYERCDRRFRQMIDRGARAEVAALLARQLDPSLPVMRAIGVGEIASWIEGQSSEEAAVSAAQIATRRYAKRQYTWFRNQCPPSWPRYELEVNDNTKDIIDIILQN